MSHFTVYVKKGKGVSELGKFSSKSGTPGSVAKKGVTSACKKSKAKTCKRTILVREHNTAVVKQYDGFVKKLKKPVKVEVGKGRKRRTVTFKKESRVKYVGTMHV